MRSESRSQSEVVGVVLLIGVVVTLVFTASAFVLPGFLSENDSSFVSIEAEATTQNVTIWHSDGDSLDTEDLDVVLRGERRERYNLTSFTQLRGNDATRFEPADKWYRSHGIDADRMEILLVDTEENEILDRVTVDVAETLAARVETNVTNPTTESTIEFDASDSRAPDGEIASYEWDFDDGTTATGEVVTHSYDDSGTYDVLLTVTTEDGRTTTRTKTIEVFAPRPEASFTVTPESPNQNEDVTFDASDSDSPNGAITGYQWDFGDGTTATGEVKTHSYAETGDFTVTLTITDETGNTDTQAKTVTIEPAVFDVTIDDVSDEVADGEEISIVYTVENTGDVSDTQDVVLKVDGTTADTNTNVQLGSDDSTTGTFTYETSKADISSVSVNASSDDDFETDTVSVVPRLRLYNAQPGESGNSEVDFSVENQASDGVTIDAIVLNATSSNADRVNNGGREELTFSGGGRFDAGGGQSGIRIDGTRYALDAVESVSGGGTTTAELLEFETDGKTAIDMNGETVTVTLYLSSGEKYTETLTVEEKPFFEVSIEDTSSPVEEGGDLTVDYTVENTGPVAGTQDVRLEFDGTEVTVDSDVSLAAGASQQGTLTYSLNSETPGEYPVTVLTDNDTDTTTVDVIQSDVPYFEVNITGTNEPVSEGDTLTVTAEITNAGSADGTQTVTLDISDSVGEVDSQQIQLNSGESTDVTLDWATSSGDAGDYSATVRSENATDTESVSVNDGPFFADLSATVQSAKGNSGKIDTFEVSGSVSNVDSAGEIEFVLTSGGTTLDDSGTTIPMSGGFSEAFDGEDYAQVDITVRLLDSSGTVYEECVSDESLQDGNDLTFADFTCSQPSSTAALVGTGGIAQPALAPGFASDSPFSGAGLHSQGRPAPTWRTWFSVAATERLRCGPSAR